MAPREVPAQSLRWRWDVAYDGTDFHGWARQPGLRTVEQTLADAIGTILHSGSAVDLVCAGRTDTGVHARGQVVHVDVPIASLLGVDPSVRIDPSIGIDDVVAGDVARTLLRRIDGVLPPDVAVRGLRPVSGDFDARFSALSRRYAYRVSDTPESSDPLRIRDVLDLPRRLDLEAMNRAAEHLLGEHDFAAFCRRRATPGERQAGERQDRPVATTVRRLLTCTWTRDSGGRAVLDIRADAFCHSMVRAIVGALIAVGEGRRDPSWVPEVLAAGVRDPGVRVMPARGLTLEEVVYPPPEEWARRQASTRSVRTPL